MSDLLLSVLQPVIQTLLDPFRQARPRWRAFQLLVVLAVLAGGPLRSQAQVLDDSTRVHYGARTTRVIREADVLRGDSVVGMLIDTTLTNLHQSRYWFHDSTVQQDLGNVGTASRPLLWQTNTQLGARLGRNVFDKYVRDPATIPFYDTRSPYSFFRYIQSSVGEQVFELSYSRSFKKTANVGFVYERFAGNKIHTGRTGVGLVDHSNVLVFARYQTDDDRYHALFQFNTARHQAVEEGGISPLPTDNVQNDLFDYALEQVWLNQAVNQDDRDQVRLAHTYRLIGRGLTVFHIADWRRQLNKYVDGALPYENNTLLYYPVARHNAESTDDRAEFRQLENTVGVLGSSNTVAYQLYGRQRYASLVTRTRYLLNGSGVLQDAFPKETYHQFFVGGRASFRWRQIFAVETAGEFKFFDQYWLRATVRTGPFTAEALSTVYEPTLTQREFNGNHYQWQHTADDSVFRNTKVNQLSLRLDQTLGKHQMALSAAFVNITDLIYYNQEAVPAQLGTARQLLIGTLRYRYHIGHLHTDNQAVYTSGGDKEGLRIPALVANAKVYYQGYVFKKALFGQIGAELYYQSKFRAYNYSPSTQQFYVQDAFTIPGTPVADVFLSADIRTLAIFLKVAYLNQGLGGPKGYFSTPYYSALPRRFQLGLRWQFFD